MSIPSEGRPDEIGGVVLQEAYYYLDELRKSGVTNMFGARPYLMEEFGIGKESAKKILAAWMQDFSKE